MLKEAVKTNLKNLVQLKTKIDSETKRAKQLISSLESQIDSSHSQRPFLRRSNSQVPSNPKTRNLMINDYSSSFGLQMGISSRPSHLNHCKSNSILIK